MTTNRVFVIGVLILCAFAFALKNERDQQRPAAAEKASRQREALRAAQEQLRSDLAAGREVGSGSKSPSDQHKPASLPVAIPDRTPPARTSTNVRKKDGTIDERDNDLQILCEDWRFYRAQILNAARAGDEQKATAARQHFQRITQWLNAYPNDDVAQACGS
jgi:hypothetical protein